MTSAQSPRRRAPIRRAFVVLLLTAVAVTWLLFAIRAAVDAGSAIDADPVVDVVPMADGGSLVDAIETGEVGEVETADAGGPPHVTPETRIARSPGPPIPLEPLRGREPLEPGMVRLKAPVPLEKSRGLEPLEPAVIMRPAPTLLEENPNGLEPLVAPVLDLRNVVPLPE